MLYSFRALKCSVGSFTQNMFKQTNNKVINVVIPVQCIQCKIKT